MSRAGGAVLLGAAMAAVATAFGTRSLLLPSVALVLLGGGFALWVWLATLGAAVERLPGPSSVLEEEPYPLRLELREGLVPPPIGELHEPLLPQPVPFGGRAARRIRIDVRFARRGRRRFEPGTLVVRDPLRLAVRELPVGGGSEELLVLPRVEPVVPVRAGGAGGPGANLDGDGRTGLRGRSDGLAAELHLDGLRPLRPGTPATRIHWPAVARTGEMLERRLASDADSAPLVVLDASRPRSDEALDRAVRAAASLCVHLARSGGCALLLPDTRRPLALGEDLAAWPSLHVRLALVEATPRAPAPARVRRAGAVLWVSASGTRPRDLARSAAAGSWFVTAEPGRGRRPAFQVAGCQGFRLGRTARRGGVAA